MKTIPWISRRLGGSVFRFGIGALAALLLVISVGASFVPPYAVPVERLVRNAEAYLAKHPDQAYAHYTLARIHYLAFHVKRDQAPALACDMGTMPIPAPQWMVPWVRYDGPDDPHPPLMLNNAQMIEHAVGAAKCFSDCLRLRPEHGLCLLGLASFCEEFLLWKERAKPVSLPAELEGITFSKARDAYAKAFALAIGMDSQIAARPLSGLQNVISYEAAVALMRLAKSGEALLSEPEKADLKLAREAVARFRSLPPPGSVTPIVFSMQPAAHLADLLAPEAVVDFDLRGYGLRESWPWVKPALGIFVWDPMQTGLVTSARELFGGYTFQIFRETGYEALAALDDNGDGVLSGHELDGISVWFDRNSDGKSEPGEVIPLSRLGVASISVTAPAHDGIHPMNPQGITMRDGRVLPTWDWMVQPVKVEERLAGK